MVDGAVAGPGFINLKIADSFWRERLRDCLKEGIAYGDSQMGAGEKVNVEYVSANPTGPLHVAHARGAVVGDALANLLAKAGYAVTKEYYINDAGAQVDKLGQSTYLRYREALGDHIERIPEGLYPGEYLKEVGAAIAKRDGARWIDKPEADWLPEMRAFAISALMAEIKADLETLGVHIDVYSSERALVDSGAVDRAFQELARQDLIYQGRLEPPKGKTPDDWEDREQTLFRATRFGDEVDRPLKKSDGSWTYFANDIAYHFDKFRRGFADMIDVWGADHGGYVKRMKAAVTASDRGQGRTRRQALPDGARAEERRAGAHVQARRQLRHPARSSGRGRPRRRALHHADAQERRVLRLRPGEGHRTVTGQSGVVRAVRPRADALGDAPGRAPPASPPMAWRRRRSIAWPIPASWRWSA